MQSQPQSRQISFDIFQDEYVHFHNDRCLRVLYFLSGSTTVAYRQAQAAFTAGGLLVTNPMEWYFCSAAKASFLTLTLPLDFLAASGIGASPHISCCVPDHAPGLKQEYHHVRKALAGLWRCCFMGNEQNSDSLSAQASALFLLLRDHFASALEDDIFRACTDTAEYRLSRILRHIHEHWSEDLRISEIAALEYLSPNYLSRFWHEHMHCTLSSYICDIRLDHAEKQLRGVRSMTDIASFCGFKNANVFNQKFIQRFGVPPKQYRARLICEKASADTLQTGGLDLSALLLYLGEAEGGQKSAPETLELRIDAAASGRPLRHTWRRLVNIGYARDGLVELVQQQLIRAQTEIGFEYIRFHGIFDDDMHVFYETPSGELRPNYIFVDPLLDFLLSIGLKPFIELGYTPRALAAQPVRVLERETYFSRVKSVDTWCALIRHFLRHIIGRYGLREVLSWKFTVSGSELLLQGYLSAEDYLSHYAASFRAIKSVCPELSVGGFGGHSSLILEVDDFEQFTAFCVKNSCIPDFFCLQNFPVEHVKKTAAASPVLLQKLSPVTISADAHYSRQLLARTADILKRYALQEKELWFEEWNASIWQRDAANDTCYKAAYILKDICENYDNVEAFGYWLLTDFIEERIPHDNLPYFGGCGLMNYNGIPKAAWNAMRLLRKLGDTYLCSGDGYFVTRGHDRLQILLYRYAHYGDMYRFCNQTPISVDRAYDVFLNRPEQKYRIVIQNLHSSDCRIRKYCIDRTHGSSFDLWLSMGRPKTLYPEELQYLAAASAPALTIQEIAGGTELVLETTLFPHSCQLFEITFSEPIPTSV